MELHKFPLDNQKCSIQLMSYAYTLNHLQLGIAPVDIKLDPIVFTNIPSFELKEVTSYNGTREYAMGDYSCAGITFHFDRYWQAYMLTVYLPSYLLVIISWLSFFIDTKSAPARVSLGVTTVLTMTTLTTSVLNSLPHVTYTKSMDIWLAACLVFIFAALVEYAIASQLNCREDRKQHKKTEQLRHNIFQLNSFQLHNKNTARESTDMGSTTDLQAAEEDDFKGKDSDLLPLWLMPAIKHGISSRCTSRHLDFHSRWLFFLLFAIFNATYWTITF
ncbi:glycine receptor subunit alpha-2-like [Amphiura filiformis]|uniref:glycine receptor subunit alpha-2-like n=1 Tax=Amphiura filiformis TaxID=82378 RepID=UPI003B225F05